jgi:hypothetical protein
MKHFLVVLSLAAFRDFAAEIGQVMAHDGPGIGLRK